MQKKIVSESRCMRKISLALKSRIWDGLEWFAARHSHLFGISAGFQPISDASQTGKYSPR